MNMIDYYFWLKKNWAKVGLVLSVYLFAFLFIFVRKADFIVFLILLQTPLYMFHEAEEYIFPGGFAKFFNMDIFKLKTEDKPLDESFIFFVYVGLIWLILPLFGLLSLSDYKFGLWIPYFTIFAGVSHIALAIKARKIYNPGLVVSLVLNIPVGVVVVQYLARQQIFQNPVFNIHLLIGIGVNLLLPIAGTIIYKRHISKIN